MVEPLEGIATDHHAHGIKLQLMIDLTGLARCRILLGMEALVRLLERVGNVLTLQLFGHLQGNFLFVGRTHGNNSVSVGERQRWCVNVTALLGVVKAQT